MKTENNRVGVGEEKVSFFERVFYKFLFKENSRQIKKEIKKTKNPAHQSSQQIQSIASTTRLV